MPKQETIQTSFVGGEFGPSVVGRTDVAQFKNAAAIVENWLIRPFGSLLSTPGLEYINQCVTGGSTTISGIRLIPFQFSVTDSYIIEMGVGYFRFYTNGAIVVSSGTPYQIPHSYASGAYYVNSILNQDNDVIYLFHGNYPPATLIRSGATNWAISNFAFTGGPFQPLNITPTTISTSDTVSGATITISASSNIFVPSGGTNVAFIVGTFWSLGGLTTSATTGLDIQGYFKITAVTNPSTATGVIEQALT